MDVQCELKLTYLTLMSTPYGILLETENSRYKARKRSAILTLECEYLLWEFCAACSSIGFLKFLSLRSAREWYQPWRSWDNRVIGIELKDQELTLKYDQTRHEIRTLIDWFSETVQEDRSLAQNREGSQCQQTYYLRNAPWNANVLTGLPSDAICAVRKPQARSEITGANPVLVDVNPSKDIDCSEYSSK